MKRIAVYGAGGLGKEIRGLVEDRPSEFSFAGYIDDMVIPTPAADIAKVDDIVIAIARPELRMSVFDKLKQNYPFSALIDSGVLVRPSVTIGKGSIICPGVRFTVDITVGSFVIINLNATIGHDVTIGRFASIMPGVNISGNVKIGVGAFIGSGATILQGLSIGSGAVVGAGAVVTKDVAPGVTVVGVPARVMKK